MPGALEDAMRLAACCDLRTVDEAVRNAELHCSQLKVQDEIPAYLKELHEERAAWTGGDLIPQNIIDEEIKAMEAGMLIEDPGTPPPTFLTEETK